MKVKSCIDGRADVAFLLYKHGIRLRRERLNVITQLNSEHLERVKNDHVMNHEWHKVGIEMRTAIKYLLDYCM